MHPDFERIGTALKEAEDLTVQVNPFAAYSVVGLLQLALRHPRLRVENRISYEYGRNLAQLLESKLATIDPAIAESLAMGWDESLDMSRQDFRQFSNNQDLPQRNYSQLRPDIKEEVILNSIILAKAIYALGLATGRDPDWLFTQLQADAEQELAEMSIDQINELVAQMDYSRDFDGGTEV